MTFVRSYACTAGLAAWQMASVAKHGASSIQMNIASVYASVMSSDAVHVDKHFMSGNGRHLKLREAAIPSMYHTLLDAISSRAGEELPDI